MKLGNVRIISKSKITILPNKKYYISLNRRDYEYSDEINKYVKRMSELMNIVDDDPLYFSIKIKDGNIHRIKPSNSFGNVISDTMSNK
jgi:hypothetical protein